MDKIKTFKYIDIAKKKITNDRDRTMISETAELNLRLINNRRIFVSEESALEYLKEKEAANEKPFYLLPTYAKQNDAFITGFDFKQVIVFNNQSTSGRVIIYLHGGSYVDEITPFHMMMLGKIAKRTKDKIYVPLYPRAPLHHFEETYDFLEKFYNEVSKTAQKVIIMGDSAGGGLTIGFYLYIMEKKMRKPDFVIALSPWLDLSNSNPKAKEYEEKDPMLCCVGLATMGKAWAGGHDIQDYRLSPKFGDLSKLDNLCLYVGTREIFYPDVLEFYEELQSLGKNVIIHIGMDMNHVYPCFPIPEGKEALKQIIGLIRMV